MQHLVWGWTSLIALSDLTTYFSFLGTSTTDEVQDPYLRHLQSQLPAYMLFSRSRNTVTKYTNYYKAWADWANRYAEVTPMPAQDTYIALYLISLLQQGKSSHVIGSTLYAIKWAHEMNGLSDPTRSFSRNLLECAHRIAKPKRKPKEPLMPSHLHAIYDLIHREHADLLQLRKFTILLISFAGFLRFAEASQLRRGDIRFYSTHMSLFIEGSKTDVYRDGHVLLISRVNSPICPVTGLARYIKAARLAHLYDDYIFRAVTWWRKDNRYSLRSTNRPISYTTARQDTLDLVGKIGLDPRLFGLHSARSGGATVAANRGVPDRLFKRHGRWVSEKAKDGYIKDSVHNLLQVTRNLGL